MIFRPSVVVLSLVLGSCTQVYRPVEEAPIHVLALNPIMDIPQVEGWVDGKAVGLAVDTGATQPVLLFSDAVRRLGGRIKGKGLMQSTPLQVSLQRGGESLDQKTDVAIVESAPYDGLFGWSTLRNYPWHLNLPKDEHHFANAVPQRVKKKWSKIKLVPNEVYAQLVDPKGRQMILDTGAPLDVYLSKSRWKAFKAQYPDAIPMVCSGYSPAAGGEYVRECLYVSEFTMGPIHLHNAVICESFADKDILGLAKDIDVIVGRGAFLHNEIWLDGKNNVLYQKPLEYYGRTRHSLNVVGSGFMLKEPGGYQYVAKVIPYSLAWNSGLRTGDVVQSINGSKYLNHDHLSYVTTQAGATARIIVKRGQKMRTIRWQVPELPQALQIVKKEPVSFSPSLPVPMLPPGLQDASTISSPPLPQENSTPVPTIPLPTTLDSAPTSLPSEETKAVSEEKVLR